MKSFEQNLQRNLAWVHLKIAQRLGVLVEYHTGSGVVYTIWATKQYITTDSQDSLSMDVEQKRCVFYIPRQLIPSALPRAQWVQWPPALGLQIREHIKWTDLNGQEFEYVVERITNGDSVNAVFEFQTSEHVALVDAV